MHVTLYAAVSANGSIADNNGSEDFLSDAHWQRFLSLAKACGNLIIGRKAYEAVKSWDPIYSLDTVTEIEKIIVSHDTDFFVTKGYTPASSPVHALELLARKGIDHALVAGGAGINSAFAKDGLVDKIILSVEPVFLGNGKNMFASSDFQLQCVLTSVEENGPLLELQFNVEKK